MTNRIISPRDFITKETELRRSIVLDKDVYEL